MRDVRSYDRVDAPRRFRPNPIGVTTLAAVNGRGAYERAMGGWGPRSAYVAMHGQDPAERRRRANWAVRGESMRRYRRNASGALSTYAPAEQARYESGYERTFGKGGVTRRAAGTRRRGKSYPKGQSPAQKRARRRESMFRSLRAKGRKTTSAARAAIRSYPFGKGTSTTRYHGVSIGRRRGGSVRRKTPKQYKTVTTRGRRKKTVAVRVRRRVRVAYGRYRRAKLTDPRTGRRRLSYMYRDRKGRYRKIPARAIASVPRGRRRKGTARGFQEVGRAARAARNMERIRRARERESARILRSGGAFVPNRRKKRRTTMKLSKRARAARKGWRRRRAAKLSANKRGRRWTHRRRHGVHLRRGRVYYRGRKPRALRGVRRARRLPRGRILLTNRRRRRHRRNRRHAAAAIPNRRRRHRRRRNARRRASATPNRRHRRRRNRRHGRRRHRNARRAYTSNRRRHSRRRHHRRHRNGRRRYTANAFFADLKQVTKSALFVAVGFIGHKVITNLLAVQVLDRVLVKQASMVKFLPYTPIVAGIPVAILGIWASGKVAPRYRTELGGGMIASLIHTGIVAVLGISEGTKKYRGYLAGPRAGGSTAWGLQGRRGIRGLGQAPTSILPHYQAVGPGGGIQQAIAGRGQGEYFQVQTSGMGEYFVSGAQGVGNYELAGPMVTSAAAGFGQVVEDGIRPDSDLDALLTLAESQAGLGEYYAAHADKGGGASEYTVPQQSQWVPRGPLWAGTMQAQDSTQRGELPAGILETPGGNGVFG